jgi:ADP-ribose pyrophosphatase YjhB (NUDIX family)
MAEKEKDCCFTWGNDWFRYRTGAIIVENNHVLFITSKSLDYYYTVGGGVHIGETAQECILREVYEETGIHYEIDHLAVVCENFFKGKGGKLDGLNCHCLELHFLMKSRNSMELNSNSYNLDDEKEEIKWIPIEQIKDYNIKPAFIKDRINEIVNGKSVLHIVVQ